MGKQTLFWRKVLKELREQLERKCKNYLPNVWKRPSQDGYVSKTNSGLRAELRPLRNAKHE